MNTQVQRLVDEQVQQNATELFICCTGDFAETLIPFRKINNRTFMNVDFYKTVALCLRMEDCQFLKGNFRNFNALDFRALKTTFEHASFRTSKLRTEFTEVSFDQVNFSGALVNSSNWTYTTVINSSLVHASFAQSVLSRCAFDNVQAKHATWNQVMLCASTFRFSNFYKMKFSEGKIQDATFDSCAFRNAVFSDTEITASCFYRCDMQSTGFKNIRLKDVAFTECDMQETNIEDALSLEGCSFNHTKVKEESRSDIESKGGRFQ